MSIGSWYWQTHKLCHMPLEMTGGIPTLCGCDVPPLADEIIEASTRVWNVPWLCKFTDAIPIVNKDRENDLSFLFM